MRRPTLVGLVMLVTSCASTKVESTWSNPNFPARKIRTFAVSPVVVGGAVSSGWDAAGFYEYWSAPLTFAEYTTEENKFVGETVLWALPDDKAMWAMRTSTRRTDPGAVADDIAATVAADLRKAGILPE